MKKKLILMFALVLCTMCVAFARKPFEDEDDAWIYDTEAEFYTYFNQTASKFKACIVAFDNVEEFFDEDEEDMGFVSIPADTGLEFIYSGKNEVVIACFTNYPSKWEDKGQVFELPGKVDKATRLFKNLVEVCK